MTFKKVLYYCSIIYYRIILSRQSCRPADWNYSFKRLQAWIAGIFSVACRFIPLHANQF